MKTNNQSKLGGWLEERCKGEHLSLRQAAAKTGVSHVTICNIMKGTRPSPETIKKLARAFGGNGTNQQSALEDRLLVLAGHRTERPGKAELTESAARLMDKVKGFSEAQITTMLHFADFLIGIKEGD